LKFDEFIQPPVSTYKQPMHEQAGHCSTIRYDMIDDLDWKTDRQAASLI